MTKTKIKFKNEKIIKNRLAVSFHSFLPEGNKVSKDRKGVRASEPPHRSSRREGLRCSCFFFAAAAAAAHRCRRSRTTRADRRRNSDGGDGGDNVPFFPPARRCRSSRSKDHPPFEVWGAPGVDLCVCGPPCAADGPSSFSSRAAARRGRRRRRQWRRRRERSSPLHHLALLAAAGTLVGAARGDSPSDNEALRGTPLGQERREGPGEGLRGVGGIGKGWRRGRQHRGEEETRAVSFFFSSFHFFYFLFFISRISNA